MHMSIKKRIIYSSILLLVLFLSMGTVNLAGSRSVMKKNNLAYLLEHENMHLQGLFRGINEFIIDEGEPLSIELTDEHIKGFDELHNKLLIDHENTELHNILKEKIGPQWKTVRDGSMSFMKNNPYISVDDDEAMMQYGKLTTEVRKLLEDVNTLAESSLEDARATQNKIQNAVSIVAVIIISAICFILFNLYRSITSPIKQLNVIAEGFGKGDLSIFMDETKNNEFGKLAASFNSALSKLSGFIAKLKDDIAHVASNAQKLSADSGDIASNADEQSMQITSAVTATEQLSSTFLDIAQNTEKVSGSARDSFELAIKSSEVIVQTIQSMETISSTVKESAQIVEELDKKSIKIGEIVKVINEIADQTNLLALNSSIEAARAGENGRGFAVVADEVKKLAEKTTASTCEIEKMIKGIQKDTRKAVLSMKSSTKEVETGSDLAGKGGNSLQQIVTSAQNVTDMVQRIAASVDAQSSANNEISSILAAIAEKANDTNNSAKNTSEFSVRLREITSELQESSNDFKLRNNNDSKPDQDMENNIQFVQDAV